MNATTLRNALIALLLIGCTIRLAGAAMPERAETPEPARSSSICRLGSSC